MRIGGKYNWKGQPEHLTYLGRNWSGNGYWHQFEKVDEPGTVWCEVLDTDLDKFEETTEQTKSKRAFGQRTERQRWNDEVEAKKQAKLATKGAAL